MEQIHLNLELHDRIRCLLPWLHDAAWAHTNTLAHIDALATNEDHRQALRTAYRVKIELAERAIMNLYDEMVGTRMKAEARQHEAEQAAIDDLLNPTKPCAR